MAVHISHHRVKDPDRGLVVIGGSVAYGDADEADVAVDEDSDDALERELEIEADQQQHARGGARRRGVRHGPRAVCAGCAVSAVMPRLCAIFSGAGHSLAPVSRRLLRRTATSAAADKQAVQRM